tara:strand:- start:2169 stop:3266 length:1098 start_codon:yes stop_codon:yes gene_type:complete
MTRPLVNPVSETAGELTSGMNIGVGGQFQLREMSDTEIKNKFARLLMGFWANQNNGKGAIILKGDHTGNRGTWIMRFRNDASASHPVSTTNFAQSNYSLDQDEDNKTTNQADNVNLRPVCRTTGAQFQEMTDTQLETDIIRCCKEEFVNNQYPLGGYHMGVSNPDGDTWVSRGSFVNKHRFYGGTSSETIHLRQKTNVVGGGTYYGESGKKPMRAYDGTPKGLIEMENTAIRAMYQSYGNAMLGGLSGTNFGEYRVTAGTTAPSTGTWVACGTWTEKFATVSQYTYSQGYTGYYSQGYTGSYTRKFGGSVQGVYQHTYSSGYTGYYSNHYNGLTVNPNGGNNASHRQAPHNDYETQDYTFWKRIG